MNNWGTFHSDNGSDQPLVRYGPGDRDVTLVHDFTFRDDDGIEYRARAPLRFDGASYPRWSWWLIGSPFTGKLRRAAVVHDQLCRDGRVGRLVHDRAMTPARAHRLLYVMARASGMIAWRAWVRWQAVRWQSTWVVAEPQTTPVA